MCIIASFFIFRGCFMSTGTVQTIRDGKPGTSTSTFTQLLSSDLLWPSSSNIALCPQRPCRLLGMGSPGRPTRLSHSSRALHHGYLQESLPMMFFWHLDSKGAGGESKGMHQGCPDCSSLWGLLHLHIQVVFLESTSDPSCSFHPSVFKRVWNPTRIIQGNYNFNLSASLA